MPELPEVETIKRDLEQVIIGKKIIEVCVHNPVVIRQPSVKDFVKGLTGAAIKRVTRRAKVLIFELSNGKSLVVHLKMTGQLVYPGGSPKSRVAFKFSDAGILDFNDQRMFGELRLFDDWHDSKFIQGLGPEPSELDIKDFRLMLSSRKTRIKPLLMDQSFISGIGNLYAAEILFRSGIHPQRTAASLSDKEKNILFKEINQVLDQAIRHGGSSIDDYVRLSGKPGDYVKYHQVYGREGKPCPRCKTVIIRTSLGGRGTFFCPNCQK